jgi:anti-sigma B factor antagonist
VDEDLHIEFIEIEGEPALAVRGEIDMATAPQFLCACNRLAAVSDRLVLDFSEVTFIDSSGLKVLVAESRRSGISGVVVRNAPEGVVRTLRLTGLGHFASPATATG